jgi:hypothetical protein
MVLEEPADSLGAGQPVPLEILATWAYGHDVPEVTGLAHGEDRSTNSAGRDEPAEFAVIGMRSPLRRRPLARWLMHPIGGD